MRLAKVVARAALAALALALVPAASASAATQLYTTPTGSESASCAANDPCSLHKAFSGPGPGDEIIVGPGTYNQTTSLLTSVPISFHGAAGQPRPVIMTTQAIALYNAASTASDLEIRTSATGNGFQVDGTSVERVVVRATPSSASGTTACHFGGQATIRDVVCWGKASSGEMDALSTGSASSADRTSILRNVTAVVVGTPTGYGIYAGAMGGKKHTLRLYNTIARHPQYDMLLAVESGGTVDARSSHSNYDNPFLFGGAGAQLAEDTPRQTTPPTFVDPANGDLHEAPGSPTIDAGLNDAANGATDADRVARTINGTTDIGGYERTLPPSATTGGAAVATTPTAELAGSVNPNGLATSYHFDYGRTAGYGDSTPAADAGAGGEPVAAGALLPGLDPKTLYHYRLVATNALGTATGADATFTTPPLAFTGVAFVSKKARVTKGRVGLKLSCADPSTLTSCTGTLTLRKKVTLRRRGRRTRKNAKVGSARFTIPAGQAKRVLVKLTKTGRRLARRKLTVSGRAVATDARAGAPVPTTAKIRLLPPRKKR